VVREYDNLEGGEVWVWNLAMWQFRGRKGTFSYSGPQITSEREALTDLNVSYGEVNVVLKMACISKEYIKINAYDNSVEVSTKEISSSQCLISNKANQTITKEERLR
jgi:HSP20 family molecular chaperone IbpA